MSDSVVRAYVTKKFSKLKGFTVTASRRKAKVFKYYNAAARTPHGQRIIEAVYFTTFSQPFPKAEALAAPSSVSASAPAVAVTLGLKRERKGKLDGLATKLEGWKADGSYQEGERFYNTLKSSTAWLDAKMCDLSEFAVESAAEFRKVATAEGSISSDAAEGSFDAMLGFEQSASIKFKAGGPSLRWGEISATLEESFRAGIWTRGSAKVQLERLGFSAEVSAAIAMGVQLEVGGDLKWQKGKAGLELAGKGSMFLGAQADFSASLSMSARTGLNAAISAGAFVGVKFEATGSCAFSYDGREVVSVAATAAFSFGAGASFKAGIAAPLFGPTTIELGAELAVGIGGSVETTIGIDFTEARLGAAEVFRAAVYLRTIARGYQPDLINSDVRNLHYLRKCQRRVKGELAEVDSWLATYAATPVDRRGLLAGMDDDDEDD